MGREKEIKNLKEVIVYTRFSPRRNAKESESNEIQLAYCEQHAYEKGYRIVGTFEDQALSGADAERPGLWAAVDRLEKDGILLVFKLDRLARNVYLMELIKQAVSECGARIEAVEGDVAGDTPESELIRQVLASISEYERKVIAVRTKFAMLQHQRNGRRMGRFPPYGYKLDPDNESMLLPVEEEQLAISRIVQLRNKGHDALQIVRKMNRENIFKLRTGKQWTRLQVEKILSNTNQRKENENA